MTLSAREKTLLGVLVIVLLALGLFAGLDALNGNVSSLRDDLARQEALLRKARVLVVETEALRLKTGARRAPMGSLLGYVEGLMTSINLKNKVQLNLIEKTPSKNIQGIELKVDNLSIDELVHMIHALENSEHTLVIDQMDVSQSFQTKDLLRVSMRILAAA